MKRAYNFDDLTGRKIHRLTFLEWMGVNENRNSVWKVQCECGTVFNVVGSLVKNGTTKSCGCLRIENNKNRHKRKILRYECK